jgi:Leucine-rich repeat (LRR) protein
LHNLYGPLPSSISNLTHLFSLDLSGNRLRGPIPASLGALSNLTHLNISENRWTGTIPPSLGNLSHLEVLDLSGLVLSEYVLRGLIRMDPGHTAFGLSGTLPDSLGNLSNLQYFSIGFNAIGGTLPNALGKLSKLEYFFVYLNNLWGPVPHSFASFRNLRKISLGSNEFSGDAFFFLENNPNIDQFIIGINNFTGTIPEVLGSLSSLQYLDMSYNNFYGTLPISFKNLTRLRLLNLAQLPLDGTFPSAFCNMTHMLYLDLLNNNFRNTIPAFLGNLSALQFLDASGNKLSGTIPDSLGQLTGLLHLALDDNRLTGTLPASLGNLNGPYLLSVGGNRLAGTFPEKIFGLTSLQFLNVSENQLTGTISSHVSRLGNITTLDLSYNKFSGTIPALIGRANSIENLNFQGNKLTGSIPKSISLLKVLSALQLQDNQLTGTLEGVFDSNLQTNLTLIQMSQNLITGTFPESIFLLPKLTSLVAVVNCFHGSLPPCICDAKLLQILALDGLQSGSKCQHRIAPLLSNAYITAMKVSGGIPHCLFKLPALKTLHMAGNGLTGSLPSDMELSASLRELDVSHNVLTGTIPWRFQEKEWDNLDLSYNHLSGTLRSTFAPVNDNASVSLQTNRLSGHLPGSIINAATVNVLKGNLYVCDVEKRDLPSNDKTIDNYSCGSNSFDIPYYAWLTITVGVGAVVAAAWYWRAMLESNPLRTEKMRLLRMWLMLPTLSDSDADHLQALVAHNAAVEASSHEANCTNASATRNSSNAEDNGKRRGYTRGGAVAGEEYVLMERLINFRFVTSMTHVICKGVVWCNYYIIGVLMVYYLIANVYYRTHEDMYAYIVSAAYKTGLGNMAAEAVLFTLFLMLVLYVFYRLSVTYKYSFSTAKSYEKAVGAIAKHCSPEAMEKLPYYTVYFVTNFVVVLGVNILFIWITFSQVNSVVVAAQVLLSLFKLAWSNLLSWYSARYFVHSRPSTREGGGLHHEHEIVRGVFTMQLYVNLVNNIAIPCFVVAAVSQNCFASLFLPPPTSTSEYSYLVCSGIVLENGCNEQTEVTSTVSYEPPFSYSYQCSSSFIKNYAPSFVYMCITASFVVPLVQYALNYLVEFYLPDGPLRQFLDKFNQYPTLRPGMTEADCAVVLETDRRSQYFNPQQLLLVQLTFLGILMTFGVVFPPLGVSMALTVWAYTTFARIKVGRFLVTCLDKGLFSFVDRIEIECTRAISVQQLEECIWMLVGFSACFYTLFLFDSIGDKIGAYKSFWILIVYPLFPVVLFAVYYIDKRSKRAIAKKEVPASYDDEKSGERDASVGDAGAPNGKLMTTVNVLHGNSSSVEEDRVGIMLSNVSKRSDKSLLV